MCKDEDQAQDILQETFIKIWDKAKSYDPNKGKFYTWAYRIARNTTLNSLRNNNDLIQNSDLSVYGNKEETQEEAIDTLGLDGAFRKLEQHHQQALRLVYYDGLTHREAHEVMEVPLGTFKSYVQQALKKLREEYPMHVIVLWLIEWMR
jgi:RNA polymerase sigma-70 factor (ECF subfamily)